MGWKVKRPRQHIGTVEASLESFIRQVHEHALVMRANIDTFPLSVRFMTAAQRLQAAKLARHAYE